MSKAWSVRLLDLKTHLFEEQFPFGRSVDVKPRNVGKSHSDSDFDSQSRKVNQVPGSLSTELKSVRYRELVNDVSNNNRV
jgi:hypothetical protein